jgi:3-hydroxyisobutyrate dehydrogenase-like beta-hydroxyacid dehydrogenase
MALNLLRAGYRVTVKGNRNRAPVEALTNAGAAEASEYLQLTAQSDIIVLCLPNSTVVEGVISSMLPGLVAGRHVIVTLARPPSSPRAVWRGSWANWVYPLRRLR